MLILLMMVSVAEARTCYPSTTTRTPYNIMERATVETKRGCEVLCSANDTCAGFSYKDDGFSSPCVLLKMNTANEICAAETTIFLKQTTGCPDRADITAEFGVDPCIDERVDSAFRGLSQNRPCTPGRHLQYFVRAIDSDGRRITLDNEYLSMIVRSGEMWAYSWNWKGHSYTKEIVAATCVKGGSVKCPCTEPLKHITDIGSSPNYPALIDFIGPCNHPAAWLYYDQAKCPSCTPKYYEFGNEKTALVKCHAGLWMVWVDGTNADNDVWGVNGLSCFHY